MEEETSSFDKILGWTLFLGLAYIIYKSFKDQQEQQQQKTATLSDNNNQNNDQNVVNYKELLANWQPLDWDPKTDSIKDLRQKLRVTIKNMGGSDIAGPQSHRSVTQDTVSQSVAAPSSEKVQIEQQSVTSTLGINSYNNKEMWKVIRGLDKRIIGYELQRNANIKST